jgi:diaminopimelate epimerase
VTAKRFYKMSGSGNDFVVFDARTESVSAFDDPVVIQALCARGTGVGADGVVFLERSDQDGADFRMRYFNSDGSPADLCGNAALCVTRLARDLGAGKARGMRIETSSGVLAARIVGALAEIDLPEVREARADAGIAPGSGETRIGWARPGIPHLVVLRERLDDLDLIARGRALRMDPSLRPDGANVDFVAPRADGGTGWAIRTYERGVEGETLACGTGAVAAAILLSSWGLSGTETTLKTRSGRELTVRLRQEDGRWMPTLRGEGRLVFKGELADR